MIKQKQNKYTTKIDTHSNNVQTHMFVHCVRNVINIVSTLQQKKPRKLEPPQAGRHATKSFSRRQWGSQAVFSCH